MDQYGNYGGQRPAWSNAPNPIPLPPSNNGNGARNQMAKKANLLLLITLASYMGVSLGMELMGALLGRFLPFLNNTMVSLVVGQLALVAPSIIFIYQNKLKLKEFLHIKKVHPVTILLVILFTYASYPVISLCNYLSLLVSENVIDDTMYSILDDYSVVGGLFAMAVLPCVVEEFIFRGVLYRSYKESCGLVKGLLVTAILFGMFHMNLNQMSYAIVMGILFIVVNEATGSMISSVLMHFLINGTSVLLTAVSYKSLGLEGMNQQMEQSQLPAPAMIAALLIASIFSVLFMALLLWGMATMEKRVTVLKNMIKEKGNGEMVFSIPLVIVFVICVGMMILSQIAIMISR